MAGYGDQAPPTFGIDFWAAAARRADAVDTSLARVPDDQLDEALWEMTSVPTAASSPADPPDVSASTPADEQGRVVSLRRASARTRSMPPPADDGPDDGWLAVGGAARLLSASPRTVSRWADQGRIQYMVTQGGHRRFWKADLIKLLGASRPTADEDAGPGAPRRNEQ